MDDLTSDAVCSIIRACGENGVTKLQYRNLNLSFSSLTRDRRIASWPAEKKGVAKEVNEESMREAELLIKDQQIEEMSINDPERYERMLLNGEIDA